MSATNGVSKDETASSEVMEEPSPVAGEPENEDLDNPRNDEVVESLSPTDEGSNNIERVSPTETVLKDEIGTSKVAEKPSALPNETEKENGKSSQINEIVEAFSSTPEEITAPSVAEKPSPLANETDRQDIDSFQNDEGVSPTEEAPKDETGISESAEEVPSSVANEREKEGSAEFSIDESTTSLLTEMTSSYEKNRIIGFWLSHGMLRKAWSKRIRIPWWSTRTG